MASLGIRPSESLLENRPFMNPMVAKNATPRTRHQNVQNWFVADDLNAQCNLQLKLVP